MHRYQGLRVAFLTRYDRSRGSSRVRVYDYLPFLRSTGWECRVLPFPQHLSWRTKLVYTAKAAWLAQWANVIVFQKLLLRSPLVDYLAGINPRLVFDFDDALWAPPDAVADNDAAQRRHRVQGQRFRYLPSWARCVIAGSEHLADYARRFMSAVHVIPSSVDLSNYPIRLSGFRNGAVAFGWIGSPENLGDFSSIHGALTKAFNEINGRAVVKIVSAEPLELNGVPVQWEPWVLDRDMNYLHSFDVGLMPLQNSERSRGRCGFKAIQYMAAGLPVVASPVGAATEIVEPWESGLLPTSDEEWREAIELLSRDAALRSRLGLSGRAQVEARFSIQVNAPKLARILGEVAAS